MSVSIPFQRGTVSNKEISYRRTRNGSQSPFNGALFPTDLTGDFFTNKGLNPLSTGHCFQHAPPHRNPCRGVSIPFQRGTVSNAATAKRIATSPGLNPLSTGHCFQHGPRRIFPPRKVSIPFQRGTVSNSAKPGRQTRHGVSIPFQRGTVSNVSLFWILTLRIVSIPFQRGTVSNNVLAPVTPASVSIPFQRGTVSNTSPRFTVLPRMSQSPFNGALFPT